MKMNVFKNEEETKTLPLGIACTTLNGKILVVERTGYREFHNSDWAVTYGGDNLVITRDYDEKAEALLSLVVNAYTNNNSPKLLNMRDKIFYD